ncbi:hypothetical protein EJ02DRAFT_227735 [Clathrospora elynae]|uniref:Uncharacterized protein n=1 Tax=Clathrospora elynae TaxID=706981 RepID=A0A6A5SLM6_9PLEO|nr:hypothetical protein EJ02DRAFT_227735 [Clathrospora elynae]
MGTRPKIPASRREESRRRHDVGMVQRVSRRPLQVCGLQLTPFTCVTGVSARATVFCCNRQLRAVVPRREASRGGKLHSEPGTSDRQLEFGLSLPLHLTTPKTAAAVSPQGLSITLRKRGTTGHGMRDSNLFNRIARACMYPAPL